MDPVISAEGITPDNVSTYFVINDVLFRNSIYQLHVNSFYDLKETSKVILETGTENYYLYMKRLLKHKPYNYQDPFKPYDPVPLYSNIENGLGIFAGYQRDIFLITKTIENNLCHNFIFFRLLLCTFASQAAWICKR